MPRGLRGKLFRCNALPHRTQPAARISSAIFSSVRTRNSTNLESSRVVWHIRGVSLVLGTQERQVYPRGSQDSRGRPPSLPQPIRWGPRKSPSRKVLRNTARLKHLLSTLQERCCHRHMQDSLPAGWLAFTGWESNPLDRDERFPSSTSSSPFPEFILTLPV